MRDLKIRTKRFAIDCWKLCLNIPKSREYESIYWLELFEEVFESDSIEIQLLKQEANELLAIVVASIKTTLKNNIIK